MEILVIGLLYLFAFGVFAVLVLTDHDPGPFATYSAVALTALLPFLRRKDTGGESTEERTPTDESL
ncbi:MAG TPA: hypothetical protein VJ553_00580 [Candidatus Paceibacterota bacterium]|nr:hypothetical protein [Candidatus Paceibacterota bacterium]